MSLVKELYDLLEACEIDGEDVDPQSIRNILAKYHPAHSTTDIVGVSWDKIDKLLEYILEVDVRPVDIRTVKAIVGYASRHDKFSNEKGGV